MRLIAPSPLRADDAPLSPDLQATILVRTLAYDHALPLRAGRTVGVGVLFAGDGRDSPRSQYEIRQAFRRMEGTLILGRRVLVQVHTYKDSAALAAGIDEKEIQALYVPSGLAGSIDGIRPVCRGRKVATLTAERSLVQRGLAIGVVAQGSAPRLLVNLAAAQSEGMSLDAKLLRMADVLHDAR
jgi:hypothetical protein